MQQSHFGPKKDGDPDLLFVLATTAEGVNEYDIAAKAQLLLNDPEQIDQSIDISRVAHEEFCWPTIVRIIEDHDSLKELFMAPTWPADNTRNKELDDLRSDMARLGLRGNWASMRRLFDKYRTAKNIDTTAFEWVPRTLMKDMVAMFLQAADFVPALALLRHAVSLHPIDAFYRLGYLRSYRFLTTFSNDGRPLQWFGMPPAVPHTPFLQRSLEDEVNQTAQATLASRGTLDERLALVLWVLSYTTLKETADLALSRAHDQLIQEWPEAVAPFPLADIHTVTEDGYIENATYPPTAAPQDIDAHRFAAALAAVFSYLRILHAQRFGGDVGLESRRASDIGWPIILGLTDQRLEAYFSNMYVTLQLGLCRFFPDFWAEAFARDTRWRVLGKHKNPPKAVLGAKRYVVSSRFLLRDCIIGVLQQRLDAVRHAPLLYSRQYLVTSNADLEYIVQVQRSLQIQFDTQSGSAQTADTLLGHIQSVIDNVARTEFHNLTTSTALIRGVPYYPEGIEPGYELIEALELSREHDIPFIAATPGEVNVALSRHPSPDLVGVYALPLIYQVQNYQTQN